MDTHRRTSRIARVIICLIPILALIWGCASSDKDKKDPFFEEWKARAEESKGYSPGKPAEVDQKPVEITEKVAPKLEEKRKEKPLPKRKISLKMTDIDVAVLLRALSRAADQNIIVSEKVTGKINGGLLSCGQAK